MASKLTIRKLALIVASTGMAGAIHSGAQAAEQIDCNSGLTQIAIASEEGSEGGISPIYAHCVSGAQGTSPAFTTKEAAERQREVLVDVAGRPAVVPSGSRVQAAAQIDCNSGLTQIAIMSQEGSEEGFSPLYEHCVSGAQGVAGRPAVVPSRSGVQAAAQIDCNSGLTQIAIMSQQGSEEGISPLYEHCVPAGMR